MERYIVSARKYRPSTFKSVVGQKALSQTLRYAIQNNKLAHAYLFCGPRGVGKTSCARIFAKTINCLTPTAEGEACNNCETCISFNEQRSFCVHELDAASNNSVDDIRALTEQVRIPPAIGKHKVYIIDEVHMLSSSAFNAFLKTLEEPPSYALFILATTEKHKVLPTILSRCQIYDFSRISIADIVEHLQYVASEEQIKTEAEALNIIAQKADGGMRDALSIFDQVSSYTAGNVTYSAVIDNLNVLDYEYYFRLTEMMYQGNIRECLLTLNEIIKKGFDIHNVITGLASHFRDLLVCKDESTLVLFEVGASILERYKVIASKCTDRFILRAIELANTCDINYRTSRNKRLLVELCLIQICQINSQPDTTQIEGKKKQIENIASNTSNAETQKKAEQATTQQAEKPQPTASSIIASMPTTPNTETTKRPQKTPAITRSLKEMSGTKRQAERGESTVRSENTKRNNTFSLEQLLFHWKSYAETITTKVHLKNALINCLPRLKNEKEIEVTLHNPGQEETLLSESTDLMNYLRDKLLNDNIRITTLVSEEENKRGIFTEEDKYKHLCSVNPLIAELKKTFQLIPA